MRALWLLGCVLFTLACAPAQRALATAASGEPEAKAGSSAEAQLRPPPVIAESLRGSSGGRLSIGELFVEQLQLTGATPDFAATARLTSFPALVKLGLLESSPRWRDVNDLPEARVIVEQPLRFEGTTGCLTLSTTRAVRTPELALASGSMFHRVRYDAASDLCVGCYVHHDDWLPGDPLECGTAFTEICGLAIPCDALQGPPADAEDNDAWFDVPENWAFAELKETDDEEGILDARVVSPVSGRTYVVLRANSLYFGSGGPGLGASGALFAPGLRLAARLHPAHLEALPDGVGVGFGGGCGGSHGRGFCGGGYAKAKKKPEVFSAQLEPGTLFHDAKGRAWATVASPLVVQYSPSTAERGFVNVHSQELDGICESEQHCSCGEDLFHVKTSELRPLTNGEASD